MSVIHKGLLSECVICNPPTEAREKRERRKKSGVPTLDVTIRRQVSAELGEDEPQKDERFQLLQKYGVAAPRIDRFVTKPKWMGVAEWKCKQNEWYKATKGLVVPQQRRTFSPNQRHSSPQQRPANAAGDTSRRTSKPWSQIKHKNPNHPSNLRRDTRAFPRNSGPTKTATLQS